MRSTAERRAGAGRRGLAVAAVIGLGTGLLVGAIAAFDLAADLRVQLTDPIHVTAEADPEVLVVAIDETYLAEIDRAESNPASSFEALLRSDAAVVVGDDELTVATLAGRADLGVGPAQAGALARNLISVAAADRWVAAVERATLGEPSGGSGLPTVHMDEEVPEAIAAQGLASVVDAPRSDVLRLVPVAGITDGDEPRTVPTAALLAVRRKLGLSDTLLERPGAIEVGDLEIPTERDQRLRVTYADELLPGGSQVMSASEFHELLRSAGVGPHPYWGGREPPFPDKIVLFGVTDPSSAPTFDTPAGPLPQVLVEANAVNTMLSGHFLAPVPTWFVAGLAGLLAFLVVFAAIAAPVPVAPAVALAGGAGWWWASAQVIDDGWLLDPSLGLVAVAVALIAGIAWRASGELRRRREVTGLLSRYVPGEVARRLVGTGAAAEVMAGGRVDATVLFCDLRGFTALSASMDVGAVRRLLDHYYEFVSRLVLEHGGTVMQYVGDEVFAAFGVPIADPDHGRHAVTCAQALQGERARLDASLRAEGLPTVSFGIGLNSGEVVAASVGSSIRHQYTVIGDVVNVGSRMCDVAAGGEIVVAPSVAVALAGTVGLRSTGPLDLKGLPPDYGAWYVASGDGVTAPSGPLEAGPLGTGARP